MSIPNEVREAAKVAMADARRKAWPNESSNEELDAALERLKSKRTLQSQLGSE